MAAAASQDLSQCRALEEDDHVRERPDTYIGGKEVVEFAVHAPNSDHSAFEKVSITCSVGADGCFGELFANVGDRLHDDGEFLKLTSRGTGKKPGKASVVVRRAADSISVRNLGSGMTTKSHPELGEPVPKVLFGRMRAGTNFDVDGEKLRPTAGRNGMGAAIVNILSKRFKVVAEDPVDKKRFEIEWADGRSRVVSEKCRAKSSLKTTGFVEVDAALDWGYFGMTGFTEHAWKLALRRIYDTAAYTGAKIRVEDGDAPPIHINLGKDPMLKYAEMHAAGAAVAFDSVGEGACTCWEVGAWLEQGADAATTVGMVNGLRAESGRHVEFARKTILDVVRAEVKAARKKTRSGGSDSVPPRMLEEMVGVLASVTILNSQFDSQIKGRLTTPRSKWRVPMPQFGAPSGVGSGVHPGWTPSAKFKKALRPVVDAVIARLDGMASATAPKKAAARSRLAQKYPKYAGARQAGTAKDRARCRLIVTEGDSAASMAKSGRSDVRFTGVVPLRGKLLNTRNVSKDSAETKMLAELLGLEPGRRYEKDDDIASLRYGELWIMTDQDVDGWHIAGLLLNWIDTRLPGLLQLKPGFVKIFATPLVVVGTRHFYSDIEFRAWWDTAPASERRRVEYYKGLGAWTTAKAKKLFVDPRLVTVEYNPVEGAVASAEAALMIAFDNRKADARREWLEGQHVVDDARLVYDADKAVDFSQPSTTVTELCEGALLHFWSDDNLRSIPSLHDGLKVSQRKAVCAAMRMSSAPQPVQRLAAKICDAMQYHHGAVSMENVVVTLAREHVGTNNVPLMQAEGQFGSRFTDAAAASRYIKSAKRDIAEKVFHEADAPLLTLVEVDGAKAEPESFWPVVPWVLVNGAEGIGTGWRCSLAPHDPSVVCAALRAKIRGDGAAPELRPWFRGWGGEVARVEGGWQLRGRWERLSSSKFRVTELPPRGRVDAYKEFLAKYYSDAKVTDASTADATDIEIDGVEIDDAEVFEKLKLQAKILDSDIVLLNGDNKPRRYGSAEAILDAWWTWRRQGYDARHAHLVRALEERARLASRKAQFVRDVIAGRVEIVGRTRAAIAERLKELRFAPDEDGGYASLLKLPIHTLTAEEAAAASAEALAAREELEALKGRTGQDLWIDDLDALERALAGAAPSRKRRGDQAAADATTTKTTATKKIKKKKKKVTLKEPVVDDFDDDYDDIIVD